MKAIVLSCDRYIKMTEHMIKTYQHRWPDNPFTFKVPYNNIFPNELKKMFGDKIELIKTETDINPTMFKLLEDIDDEEMLYWCIDDKYLVYIDINRTNSILNFLETKPKNIDGIGLSYRNSCISNNYIKIKNMKFYRRTNYKKIWLHQFLKKKVLKYLFENIPNELEQAKHMDFYIKEKIKLPFQKTMYVSGKTLMDFNESTKRGIITKECKISMKKYNVDIPINPKKAKKAL